ncbi:zinc ribbon domain-containing protein [Oceanobacillus saliphilus]|uniref:zinc ribbon domain-containing protein n=1 Tax=Oceanobacillus saliphilus TaxID=2925834 RepID=UPI00201E630E|nr:hypothetical protein [Oceanobacillus saliphilus]
MDKFCKECGGSIEDSLNFCKHCGHTLESTHAQKKVSVNTVTKVGQSRDFSKKQKIAIGAVAALVIMISGFYMWGKSYASPEKMVQRFVTAIHEEDYKTVQKNTVLNGSEISKAEAEAFVSLAKANYINLNTRNLESFTRDNDLFYIMENGKWLGIFPNYSMALIPQFVEVHLPFEDVVNTFNENEFTIFEKGGRRIVYGPMSPGIYNLNSTFSGEYTEVESDESIILADGYGDWTLHYVDMDADYVTLDLYNMNGVPITNAYIEINDQQVKFDEDFRIEELGPLDLDGSITVTPVVETEWGEVKSEPIELEGTYYDISVNTVSEALMDELSDAILLYGEEYVQANASYSANLFTTITAEMRESFANNFEYYMNSNNYFSGQLDSLEIDFNDLTFHSDYYTYVPAKFYFTSAEHGESEEADLGDRIDHVDVELVYDTDEGKWLVNSSYSVSGWYSDDFTATRTLDGSKEFYKASKVAQASEGEVASAEASSEMNIVVEEVTINYVYQLVEAINSGDYEQVRPYIKDGSSLNAMQTDLVTRLYEKGMTQEVMAATVASIDEVDGNWLVTTNETIKLTYESGEEETNDYTWTYTVEENKDGAILVNME